MAKFKGTKGDDILDGTNGDDWLFSLAGNDQLYGHRGNDLLVGGLGNDVLRGGRGNDTLIGGIGNDRLVGGLGNDELAGGCGTDVFVHRAGDGFDTVAAGGYDSNDLVLIAGADYYDFNYAWSGDDLQIGAALDGNYDFADTGSLTFKNFLSGDAGFITVQIDTLYNDFYGIDPELATFRIERGLTGINNADHAEIIIGTAGSDIINGNGGYYDGLFGGDGNDIINGGFNGDAGTDVLRGGDGDDVLNGFEGFDRLRGEAGNDVIDGGEGPDRADYNRAVTGVIVDLSIGQAIDDGEGGHDTLINVENIQGSDHSDVIIGDENGNVFRGRSGDDSLNGGLGDDVLLGDDGDDSLRGDAGNDLLDGGEGTDQASYGHASAGVWVNLAGGVAFDDGEGGFDTLINIEDVQGSDFADLLLGSMGANRVMGGGGDDLMEGWFGDDFLWGQGGSDTFVFLDMFQDGNDILFEFEGDQDKLAFNRFLMSKEMECSTTSRRTSTACSTSAPDSMCWSLSIRAAQ